MQTPDTQSIPVFATDEAVHREALAARCIADFGTAADSISRGLTDLANGCGLWFSDVQGFTQKNFATDCMLVVTELAEAVEADRNTVKCAIIPNSEHIPEFTGVEEELVDVLVRIFHMASKYNLAIGPAFVAKMQFNFTRPVKHGKEY